MINLLARNEQLCARIPFGVSVLVVLGILPGFAGEAPRPPVTIGAGSGHLRYLDAQAALKLQPGDTLLTRPGRRFGRA
jgi:hypothetical protein